MHDPVPELTSDPSATPRPVDVQHLEAASHVSRDASRSSEANDLSLLLDHDERAVINRIGQIVRSSGVRSGVRCGAALGYRLVGDSVVRTRSAGLAWRRLSSPRAHPRVQRCGDQSQLLSPTVRRVGLRPQRTQITAEVRCRLAVGDLR